MHSVPPWQRLLALSGVAFAVLLVAGWFLSGGNTPDYAAPDQDWTKWADDNQWRSRVGGFLILLAGFVFLHFAGTLRSVLGNAEVTIRGSVQLARVVFAGALTGITGITIAIVIIASAATEGADADPMVSKAVTSVGGGALLRRCDGLCRHARGGWAADIAERSLRPLDGHRGTDRRAVLRRNISCAHSRHQRRQRVRLRLSSWHLGARDLVHRDKRRGIPSGGDLCSLADCRARWCRDRAVDPPSDRPMALAGRRRPAFVTTATRRCLARESFATQTRRGRVPAPDRERVGEMSAFPALAKRLGIDVRARIGTSVRQDARR